MKENGRHESGELRLRKSREGLTLLNSAVNLIQSGLDKGGEIINTEQCREAERTR